MSYELVFESSMYLQWSDSLNMIPFSDGMYPRTKMIFIAFFTSKSVVCVNQQGLIPLGFLKSRLRWIFSPCNVTEHMRCKLRGLMSFS